MGRDSVELQVRISISRVFLSAWWIVRPDFHLNVGDSYLGHVGYNPHREMFGTRQ